MATNVCTCMVTASVELVVDSAPLRPARPAADQVVFPRANQRLLIRLTYHRTLSASDSKKRWALVTSGTTLATSLSAG
jgi:hypothetical protein